MYKAATPDSGEICAHASPVARSMQEKLVDSLAFASLKCTVKKSLCHVQHGLGCVGRWMPAGAMATLHLTNLEAWECLEHSFDWPFSKLIPICFHLISVCQDLDGLSLDGFDLNRLGRCNSLNLDLTFLDHDYAEQNWFCFLWPTAGFRLFGSVRFLRIHLPRSSAIWVPDCWQVFREMPKGVLHGWHS